jgi:asparagine synthase (glutamine-hydrolysing)
MCEHMYRRGPDAAGLWVDGKGECALGLRRLAIVDLDPRSDQPMRSIDGRYLIVFNGEIYNYQSLRSELITEGVALRTKSDTEVILELFAREGPQMLMRLRGMFAFAIWDVRQRTLFLARDPYGIKPLYLAKTSKGYVFASQVKAILASGLVTSDPDMDAQAKFWMLGSVPEPQTWYASISLLRAGHYVYLQLGQEPRPVCWWDIGAHWRYRGPALEPQGIQEIVSQALKRTVRSHLVADVPVGIMLSGGVDSAVLAALIAESGITGVHAVTLSFSEFEGRNEDEVPRARHIARRYAITHHVRRVTREEFQADLPEILRAMDQPTIDGINTWFASKAISEIGLKVVVSGIGGDELFQGYSTFRQLPRLTKFWRAIRNVPLLPSLANFAFTMQAAISSNFRWKMAGACLESIEGAWFLRRSLFSPEEIPSGGVGTHDYDPRSLVRAMTGPLSEDSQLALGQIDSMTYLRNQILRDADWSSMSHSVELRTPLVDAWLLRDLEPVMPQLAQFPHKALLASAPDRALDSDFLLQRKTGFGIPTAVWMGLNSEPVLNYSHSRLIAQRVAAQYAGS